MSDSVLRTRVQTAIALLVPAVLIIAYGGRPFFALLLIVFLCVQLEVLGFTVAIDSARRRLLALLSLTVPFVAVMWGWSAGAAVHCTLVMIVFASEVCAVERAVHQDFDPRTLGALALMCGYTVPLGALLVVQSLSLPRPTLLWFLFAIIASDTCAYFCGRAFGRRLLAPRISPKKTVAGAVGGILGPCIVSLVAFRYEALGSDLERAILLGVTVGACAIFGDLAQSLMKRCYGVKDSGTLLPGHGGVFDRVDALLFAAPVLFLVGVW